MLHRATTFLVVLAIVVGGTSALHAQSLSPDEESKLDARLEYIIQKANQGELEGEIDRYTQKLENARQQAAQDESRSNGLSDREMTRSDLQKEKLQSPRFTAENVRPAGRTDGGTPEYQAVVYTDNPASLKRSGVRVGSTFDGFATVRATPEGLSELSGLRTVNQVLSPKRVRRHNDEAAAEAGVRTLNNGIGGTEYTGEGTMTCVIDTGIDWDHPDFTDDQGRSRIRYIWDQIGDARGVGPPEYGDFRPQYGDEYGPADIQSGNVEETDSDGHGTHVTGTVASSGNAYEQTNGVEKFKGMAPDADIITVKAGGGTAGFSNVGIIDGINYCNRVAEQEGKPVVVNMSLGTLFRPGDGTSPLAAATTALTDGGSESGMVVVASAGNSGSEAIHTGPADLPAPEEGADADSTDIGFTVGEPGFFGSYGYAAVLWAYEIQEYSLSVYTPEMEDTLTVAISDSASVDSSVTTPNGSIQISSSPSLIGGNRFFLITADDVPDGADQLASGEWTFRLRNEGDTGTDVHGWQFPPLGFFVEEPPNTQFTDADRLYTLGSPSTATGAISVGAYTHRTRWSNLDGFGIGFPPSAGIVRDSIATFSSRGPLVGDGPDKPEITASGQIMVSALSGSVPIGGFFGLSPNVVVDENHFGTQGTSMSAPTVAGSVALLLQEDPTLSTNRVRDLLAESARVDDAVDRRGGAWNPTFGNGKLNALGALTRLRQGQGSPPMEVLSYHDEPFLFDNSESDTLGVNADSLALRFTPGTSGFVSGAYISVAGNDDFQEDSDGNVVVGDSANKLTDSLYVQVYSGAENDTLGAPVGDPVAVPPSQLRSYQSNFVSFDGAAASVDAGTDYYLVVTTGDEEDGSLRVLAESIDGTSGRSLIQDGSSWSTTDNDLVMRAQVSADVFPPAAVAGLNAPTQEPGNVELSWDGIGEADQYYVYRDTEPTSRSVTGLDPFATVESGTTTFTDEDAEAGQTYYYRVAAVNEDGNRGEASSEVEAFLYPQTVAADASVSFGDDQAGSSGATYRLVALPGNPSETLPIEETLDGEAGLDWQAYAVGESGTTAFDGSDAFSFEAGTGFWLSSTGTWSVTADHSTVALSDQNNATVDLHDGWNLVSNPTGKDISFSAIQEAHPNDTLQALWAFDGTWSRAETMSSASSGEAYYFNNTEGLGEMRMPYPDAPTTDGGATSKATQESSLLALSARSTAENSPVSTVKVGLDPNASDGLDAGDQLAPTGRFEPVSLRLETSEQGRSLLLERRSPIENGVRRGHTFDLRLDSDVSGPVQLSARDLESLEGYEVVLLNPSDGQTYDLRGEDQVTVNPTGEATSLKLAIGSKAYVDGQAENIIPDEVALSSYPNPFRQQGTLEYALPDKQKVRLVLYDVLGRKVRVLESGRKDAGTHTVRLDGGELASGIYFGRLEAGDKQLTQKITVVR